MYYERTLPSKLFSSIEIIDLVKAWVAISIAFTILFGRNISTPMGNSFWGALGVIFLISFFTAGTGFLLHELGHKFVAQHYGYWAEFRASNKMLFIMLVTAFMGFLFAAPGAVYIHGHVNRKTNGIISAAGPLVNLVLALMFFALMLGTSGLLQTIGMFGMRINAFLGIFNMIPFGVFDGKKIKKWSEPAFWGLLVALGALLVLGYMI